MKKDLLFDLDDTLVALNNSKNLTIIEVLKFYINKNFSNEAIEDFKITFKEKNIFNLIKLILYCYKIEKDIDSITNVFLEFYTKIGLDNEKLLIDILLLKKLKEKYDLNIITNRPRKFYNIIWRDRLKEHFKNVVCFDDFPNIPKKPNSLVITNSIKKLNLSAEFYIGNEENDLIASKKANLKCILITKNKDLNANFILENINKIENIFL